MNRADFILILRENGLCKDIAEYAWLFMAPSDEGLKNYPCSRPNDGWMPRFDENRCEDTRDGKYCENQIEYVIHLRAANLFVCSSCLREKNTKAFGYIVEKCW